MILLSEEFTRHIESILVPLFRAQGFTQQGIDNYRRIHKPFIYCVNLQERSDKKAICVNMGVHLNFLPVSGQLAVPPENEIFESSCSIRSRLALKDQSDCWWIADPAQYQVESIKQLFQQEGISFFEKYSLFPGIFESVAIMDIESGNAMKVLPGKTRIGMAMFLACVYDYLGKKEQALQFAQYGLKNIGVGHPQKGKGLIKPFKEIIKRNS
jgi:hypothetical protein